MKVGHFKQKQLQFPKELLGDEDSSTMLNIN